MYKCSKGNGQKTVCEVCDMKICNICPHGIKIHSERSKLLNIIKENIDVIKMNLQKKYQCADKEYMLTGNKDRLKEISEMLFYIEYLEKRKEYKNINETKIVLIPEAKIIFMNNKRIYQSNFRLGKIKGAKTLWKK